MPSHKAQINVEKIDKEHLIRGKKGTYLDVVFMENRDGQDQYGNDGFIVQSVSKEARERGERGPIIGNWSHWNAGERRQEASSTPQNAAPDPKEGAHPDDDIPF